MNSIEVFKKAFESLEPESKVAIFSHVNPDPDSMGSAVGIQWILKTVFNISSDIYYGGTISHPMNRTLVSVLCLDLKAIDEFKEETYDKIVLVDCTEQNTGLDDDAKVSVIIDHHKNKPNNEDNEYDYVNIVEYGSCSTIVYEMSKALGLTIENDIIATALLMGIKEDTNDLLSENTCHQDHDAYIALASMADTSKVTAINSYPLPKYLREIHRVCLLEENEDFPGSAHVCYAGNISALKRDTLPVIANELVRIEGITTSVTFAIIDDCIEFCVRSSDVSLDVDKFCKKIGGRKNAGGKKGAGAGKIPLGFFESYPPSAKEHISKAVRYTMFAKIREQLTGETEEIIVNDPKRIS